MAEHPNATLIREALAAFNAGQPGALVDLLADDVVFTIPGTTPMAGVYRGKGAVVGFLRHLGELSEAPLRVELLHLLTGGDDLVVAVWRAHAARKGWEYAGIAGYLFRMREGKIVEGTNLQADQEEIDRFWSA